MLEGLDQNCIYCQIDDQSTTCRILKCRSCCRCFNFVRRRNTVILYVPCRTQKSRVRNGRPLSAPSPSNGIIILGNGLTFIYFIARSRPSTQSHGPATWTGGVRVEELTLPRFLRFFRPFRFSYHPLTFHLEQLDKVGHEHRLCVTTRRIKSRSSYPAG